MSSLPFDWSNYQKLAQQLVTLPDEQCLRSAISRSYYFAMHQSKERLLQNKHPLVLGSRTHQQVWDGFANSPDIRKRQSNPEVVLVSWVVCQAEGVRWSSLEAGKLAS